MAQSADPTSLCEICIGGPGEYYCQQCDQFFCGNCKLSHLRAKVSKNHAFFCEPNINKEEKRLCIEHEERFLFYCHDCDTPVCRSCSLQIHHGHLMTDLTKSAVKLKFELVKIIELTRTTSTLCIGKIEEDTKTYHQKTEAVNKTITEEGNYYKELIDKKVHSFVKLVQDETQKALGSMSTATKVYLDILEHCQQWQKKITEMETKSDVLLFKKLKHLKTDVDQIVLKQSLDTPRPSVSYINKELSDTDIDNLFGELTFHYSSGGGRSDTGKEKISLRAELTEALKNIEKIRQEYSDLSEKYETGKIATKRTIESLQQEKDSLEKENVNFRAKLDHIQSDLNHYKNEQIHEQDSSHGKIEHLLQQNRNLDNDRELLRGKIFSLENEKIKLEDMLNKSKEDIKNLEKEQDNLQDNLRERSNELRDSEARYQKETSDRMSSDNISTKYKEDNDRLRKERNDARTELQRVIKEKKESVYQNLNAEKVLAREELQKKERENLELVALFKDKEDKDLQKNKLYEKEIESLKSRCRDYNDKMRQSEHDIETLKSKRKDDNDKIHRFEREIYTLKFSCRDDEKVQKLEHENETLKSRCRNDQDNIQRLISEIETLKSSSRDDNNNMRQMEREIENLKSRLKGEKANQHSAYDVMQYKNDLETCRHQKKALEDERNELQKENNVLENELLSLNSKLEQFEDSVRNISNLKKQIKDHEEGLALKNEEQASLGKECDDLKILLQQKQKEVNNLKSRFKDLAVSKETSEVLNKIVENLQQEKSDLKQRLEIDNEEKSSVLKENKKLKNILLEKLSEVKRLETRWNQAETNWESMVKERVSLKNTIENQKKYILEIQNRGELKDGLLQKSESTVQKMQKDNLKLQTEIISQIQKYDMLNNKLETLKDKNLELDDD